MSSIPPLKFILNGEGTIHIPNVSTDYGVGDYNRCLIGIVGVERLNDGSIVMRKDYSAFVHFGREGIIADGKFNWPLLLIDWIPPTDGTHQEFCFEFHYFEETRLMDSKKAPYTFMMQKSTLPEHEVSPCTEVDAVPTMFANCNNQLS